MARNLIMKLASFIPVTICLAVYCDESAKQSDHKRGFIIHEKSPKNNSMVARAVIGIIENYFVKDYPQVDLYICGEKFGPSETLANEILRLKKDKVQSRIFGVENQSYNLTTSSIILFDSVQKFKQTVDKIKWLTNEEKRYRHLVYIPGVTNSDIIENIPDGFLIDHVNFLMHESPESIKLVASYMFTAQKCRENQLIVVNTFMENISKWEGSTFYPKKYQNLHNCPLSHMAKEEEYYVNEDYFNQYLLESLRIRHNFSIVFRPEEKEHLPLSQFDLIYSIFFETYTANTDPLETVVKSPATGSFKYVLVVPPGEPYTPFEKMYIMFDEGLWIAIGLTFLFSAIVILVVNKCSARVQNIVYGHNVRSPFVNLMDIFLNGGQIRLPSRYFARILLILFVYWSLIIRTCYQSMMFTYLQADMRKQSVQSLDELIERNYTLIGPEDHFGYHKSKLPEGLFKLTYEPYNKDVMNRLYYLGIHFLDYYMCFVTEPEHRSAMMVRDGWYDKISRFKYRSGLPSLVKLDENIITVFYSYQMLSFSPFFEEFNENIGKLNSNGLNAKWIEDFKNPKGFQNYYDDEVGAQVLTFEHLETCFWICMVPAVLATVAFIVEISIRRVRAFNKSLKDTLVAWFTIRAFIKYSQGSNVPSSFELLHRRIEIFENAPSELSEVV